MEVWLFWIYILASVRAIRHGILVVMQTWEHPCFARSRLAVLRRYPRKGKAMVAVPCRGGDVGLEGSLRSLFHQAYGNYRIWFVVGPGGSVAAVRREAEAGYL